MSNRTALKIIRGHEIMKWFKQNKICNEYFPFLLISVLCIVSLIYTVAPTRANATDPQKAPLILSPMEGQIYKPGWAADFTIRVPDPANGSSFDAYLEIERKPLSQSKPYEKYYQHLIKNKGVKDGVLGVHVASTLEGYYRARAQIRYNNKPLSGWSAWRHYSFASDIMPTFLIQPSSTVFNGSVPVRMGLPKTIKKGDKIRLQWAWRYTNPDNGTATFPMPPKHFLSGSNYSEDQPVSPGKKNNYFTQIPSVDFLKAKNAFTSNPGEGEYKLFATLIRNGTEGNTVESQHWFHFSSSESIKTHFQVLSPVANTNYGNTIPVKISLPNEVKEGDKIRFKWSWQYTNPASGTSTFPLTPRTFLYSGQYAGDHSIKPGQSEFKANIPVSDFIQSKEAYTDNPGIGEYKLFVSLIRAGKELKTAKNKGWFTLTGQEKDVARQFAINAPRAGEIYSVGQYLPIHIALPETLNFDSRMRVKLWCDTSSNWTTPKVIWKKDFDNLESFKGQVFDYKLYMSETTSAPLFTDSDKNPLASCKISANLLSSGIPMVSSKTFSFTHDTGTQKNSYTLLSPDSNRTYTETIPVHFQFPPVGEPGPDDQWSIKMIWKIQPVTGIITPGMDFSTELNLATQTFVNGLTDNWDGMPGTSRTWSGGAGTTMSLSFSMPVRSLLEKAGVSGGKITLEVRFLDRDQELYTAKRSFQVQITEQTSKQGGFHFLSPSSKDVFTHSVPVDLELSKLADKNKDKLFFTVSMWATKTNGDKYRISKFLENGREFLIANNLKDNRFQFNMPISWFSDLKRAGTDSALYQLEATLVHDGKPAQSIKTKDKFECSQSGIAVTQKTTLTLGKPLLSPSLNTTATDLTRQPKELSINSLHNPSGLQQDPRMSQTEKSHISGITSQKSINPQPEPPGMQMRNMKETLQVMHFNHSFRSPANVEIRLKNTIHSRTPFQLRYKSTSSRTFKTITPSEHNFHKTDTLSVLSIKLKKVGRYQIRFRTGGKSQWSPWNTFDITGKTDLRTARTRIQPTQATGKLQTIRPQSKHATSLLIPKEQVGHSTGQLAKQIRIVPPKIVSPRNGQKFLMNGKQLFFTAVITHVAGQKLQAKVEYRSSGHFIPLTKVVVSPQTKTKTLVDMLITHTGNYRLRIRPEEKGAHWSNWRKFSIDKPMKKMPKLHQNSPQEQIRSKPTKPSSSRLPVHSIPGMRIIQ